MTPMHIVARPLIAVLALALCPAASGGAEPKPIGHWLFTPEHVREADVKDLAGGDAAKMQRAVPVGAAGATHALQLDGGANAVAAADKALPVKLRSRFSAESWVRIDAMPRWTRSVGVMARRNERRWGWVLGTHERRFVFCVAAGGSNEMTDLHSLGSAHPGRWYHLVGTYDGKAMRLYVNGILANETTRQSGDIDLPADVPLSMGDYHDGAEFYPMRGLLHEVRVYDQVLTPDQVREHYLAKAKTLDAAPPLVMSGCFGDNMVLQRDVPLPVWGQTLPGDSVTVTLAGNTAETKADDKGMWRVTMPALPAGGPHEMTIATPRGKITYTNALAGEVWYCAGQSNLAWGTRRTGEYHLAGKPLPQMRLFTVVREHADHPAAFTGGWWDLCDAGTAAEFSAVGFYFGRRIHEELKVPVGLFNASWGGTPVESWIPRDVLATLPEMKSTLAEKPVDLWEMAGLYNQMTHPLIPYAMRGVVWYQGESNIHNPHRYRQRFSLMITDWRRRWGLGDFPFYYVQIAPVSHNEKFSAATAELWDAQRRTLALPNTGMSVSTDATSNLGDNHASNKYVIAERLALWALAKTYGRDIVYSGPLYREMKAEGGSIRIAFDHAAGLKSRNAAPLDHFTIAGDDRKFHPAQATIDGDAIIVRSPDVKNPVAVRFGWSSVAQPNLVNAANLPASPFRTDDWPGVIEAEEAAAGN